MTKLYDAQGAICPRAPKCDHICHFTDAGLKEPCDFGSGSAEDTTTRKVKPYPEVPADIEPVPDTWHTIGAWMLGGIMAVLAVICLGLFFTGLWVWSLLI